jgi:hypothetical protein
MFVWQECRDFVAGERAIKAHDLQLQGAVNLLVPEASSYLPRKSSSQPLELYYSYVDSAMFFNAPGRTVDGLVGLVFSHDPEVVLPPGTDQLEKDADLQGTPLKEFAEHVLREVLTTGRGGILVDHTVAPHGISRAEEEQLSIRSYLNFYSAEDIIDWTTARIDNIVRPVRIVLKSEPIYDEGYNETRVYLELYLDYSTGYRQFRMKRWTENKESRVGMNGDKEEFIAEDIPTTTKNGRALDFIPFWFISSSGSDWKIGKPPISDLVKVSRAHYRNSAQYENGLEYCGNPTPVLAGFPELLGEPAKGKKPKKLALGSSVVLITQEAQAHASYLEFTGQGLGALERALEKKESMMAMLGSRMLYESKKSAEAAEALKIRYSGESATLSDIANVISRVLTQAIQFACDWSVGTTEAYIHLNTNYISAGADSNELAILFQMYLKGSLTREDFVRRLRAVGIVNEDRSVEMVMAEMLVSEKEVRDLEAEKTQKNSEAKIKEQMARQPATNSTSDGVIGKGAGTGEGIGLVT